MLELGEVSVALMDKGGRNERGNLVVDVAADDSRSVESILRNDHLNRLTSFRDELGSAAESKSSPVVSTTEANRRDSFSLGNVLERRSVVMVSRVERGDSLETGDFTAEEQMEVNAVQECEAGDTCAIVSRNVVVQDSSLHTDTLESDIGLADVNFHREEVNTWWFAFGSKSAAHVRFEVLDRFEVAYTQFVAAGVRRVVRGPRARATNCHVRFVLGSVRGVA
jgi:hypothetical protein